MSENNNHIDPTAFKEYFSDKLNSDEKIVFEKALENDAFEKEAFEGFQSLEEHSAVTAAILDIENRIDKKTNISSGNSKIIAIWKPLAIAASFLFILGSVFFISNMLKNNENKLADNSISNKKEVETPKEYTPQDILVDSEVEEETESIEMEDASIEEGADLKIKDISIPAAKEEVLVEKLTQSENITPAPVTSVIEDVESDEVEEMKAEIEQDVMPSQELSATTPISKIEESEVRSSSSINSSSVEIAESDDFKKGKANYENKNFNEAINYFEKSSSENKNVVEAEYYIAMSFYNLNKYSKAIKSFDKVIQSQSPLKNNALWYKSKILLNQGKQSESKVILQELAAGKSTFKNKAIEKLKTID